MKRALTARLDACAGGKIFEMPTLDWIGKKADLWADRSKGRCLFIMPNGPDLAAIEELIRGRRRRETSAAS